MTQDNSKPHQEHHESHNHKEREEYKHRTGYEQEDEQEYEQEYEQEGEQKGGKCGKGDTGNRIKTRKENGGDWSFAGQSPVAPRSLARRLRESLFRKTMRAVIGSGVLLEYIDLTVRLVVTEILLWMLVWKASACTEVPGWSVTNFLLPCIVSGVCQMIVRDALGRLVSKHTRECARCVQRTALKHWGSEAAWAGLKTVVGLVVAAATICASRAGLLEPSLIEIGAWQIVLTSFAVDLTRNRNHPARLLLAKCIRARWSLLSWRTVQHQASAGVGDVTTRPDMQRASRALRPHRVVASHVQVPASLLSPSADAVSSAPRTAATST